MAIPLAIPVVSGPGRLPPADSARPADAADPAAALVLLAHELQSPLAALRFALAEDAPVDATGARRALADLYRLVDCAQQLARLDAGAPAAEPQRLWLLPWLRQLLAAWRLPAALAPSPAAAPPVQLQGDVRLRLTADPLLLQTVLHNLLGNALRHGAPPWGLSAMRLRRRRGAGMAPGIALRLRNRVYAGGGRQAAAARLSSPESPLARGAAARAGQGLGLWLAQRLVQRMHGELRLLPAIRRSRTVVFELWLPTTPCRRP